MTNERYTVEGLPIVSKSILEVFNRDCIKDLQIYGVVSSENDQSIFFQEIRKMAETQPELFSYLEREAKRYFNEVNDLIRGQDIRNILAIAYMSGVVSCYTTLRKQAEANKLEDGLG